jgi:hypothetical protein
VSISAVSLFLFLDICSRLRNGHLQATTQSLDLTRPGPLCPLMLGQWETWTWTVTFITVHTAQYYGMDSTWINRGSTERQSNVLKFSADACVLLPLAIMILLFLPLQLGIQLAWPAASARLVPGCWSALAGSGSPELDWPGWQRALAEIQLAQMNSEEAILIDSSPIITTCQR